jgi:large subunit ribosomal protein L32
LQVNTLLALCPLFLGVPVCLVFCYTSTAAATLISTFDLAELRKTQARVRLVRFLNLADERGPEEVMAKHPVPKKKTSKSKRDMRRSHHALVVPNLTTCKNCGSKKIQHVVCGSCGYYDGRQVLEVSA